MRERADTAWNHPFVILAGLDYLHHAMVKSAVCGTGQGEIYKWRDPRESRSTFA